MFYVGQKVVLIDSKWNDPVWHENFQNLPKEKEIYQVRQVGFDIYTKDDNSGTEKDLSLWLEEIVNAKLRWSSSLELREHGFPAWRFRPLIEKKTSIAVFQEILVKVNKGKSVDAN